MTGWRNNFLRALAERAVSAEMGDELLREADLEAAERGLPPEQIFGPATAYADQLARALRVPSGSPLALAEQSSPALRLNGISKRYGRRQVLNDVTLEVRHGESVAVVGANGSGKSTLLKVCAGTVKPDAGTVERTEHVGYVPQSGGTAEFLTATEHFELFAAARQNSRRRGRATGERLAASLGWSPSSEHTAGQLSGGIRQKLNVVLGELSGPDLLLLDEPYQGFDHGSYIDLWTQIDRWREKGTGVLIVTHMLGDLDRVDRIIELDSPED
ncbi:MAG TPA: ATP-binding cassette domain-containing protein [Microthrixaceae bacterium]|jgi:ABC-type multidrug transport system ATPase subunit|nr:ATP-binding cassette domain-containing protein [Rhodoglobus sp.]HQF94678.1 ATP-binding cassette domain-containing protein [Microthrixaceae bacterium]